MQLSTMTQLGVSVESCKKYPYLLKGLAVKRSDQIWCVDITYIRILYGFLYLVAITDPELSRSLCAVVGVIEHT